MASLLDITVADGKYRIIQAPDGAVTAYRHGEKWLNVTCTPGSNMILAMAYELDELRAKAGGEAAIAIGEEAFKAGFNAARRMFTDDPLYSAVEDAWSKYEPSETVKALA